MPIKKRQNEANRECSWIEKGFTGTVMNALKPATMQTGHMRNDGQSESAVTLLTTR